MSTLRISVALAVGLIAANAAAEPPLSKYSPPKVDKKLVAEYRALAKKSTCPKGLPYLQGSWRFIGESRVPGFSDVITFKGAKYTEQISGGVPPRAEKGTLTGSIACIKKNRVLIRVEKATPEGVFGNRSGEDYPCDFLTPVDRGATNRFLLVCYVEWDLRTAKGLDLEFKKVEKAAPAPAPAVKKP